MNPMPAMPTLIMAASLDAGPSQEDTDCPFPAKEKKKERSGGAGLEDDEVWDVEDLALHADPGKHPLQVLPQVSGALVRHEDAVFREDLADVPQQLHLGRFLVIGKRDAGEHDVHAGQAGMAENILQVDRAPEDDAQSRFGNSG